MRNAPIAPREERPEDRPDQGSGDRCSAIPQGSEASPDTPRRLTGGSSGWNTQGNGRFSRPVSGRLLQARLARWRPLLILIFLAVSAASASLAVQHHLGLPLDPAPLLVLMATTFFVYTINRYADMTEDFANDSSRAAFFARNRLLLPLGIAAGLAAMLYLGATHRLHWFHLALAGIGIAYSYPLLPVLDRQARLRWARIKQQPFLKGATIGLCWSTGTVILPMLHAWREVRMDLPLAALMIGFFLAVFTSATHCDLEDAAGDALAGNATLPVLLGTKATYVLLAAIHGIWIATLAAAAALWGLGTGHLAVLLSMASFPLAYLLPAHFRLLPKSDTDVIADLCVLHFALGLVLLGSRGG